MQELKLLAWIGPDERTNDPGIKQAFMSSHGIMPLVARESKPWILDDEVRAELQKQANVFGKPIYLARYVIQEIVETITPKHQQQ